MDGHDSDATLLTDLQCSSYIILRAVSNHWGTDAFGDTQETIEGSLLRRIVHLSLSPFLTKYRGSPSMLWVYQRPQHLQSENTGTKKCVNSQGILEAQFSTIVSLVFAPNL